MCVTSVSTSIGRSACRNARTAISTAMCAMALSTRPVSCAPSPPRLPQLPRASGKGQCPPFSSAVGRPRSWRPKRSAPSWRPSHAAGPSRIMPRSRWRPIRPASRPRGSPAFATPELTGSRSGCRLWTMPRCARSGACIRRDRPCRFRPLFVRSHLRAPRADAGCLGERAHVRPRAGGRASFALSAHDRARYALLRVARCRQAAHTGRRHRARAL